MAHPKPLPVRTALALTALLGASAPALADPWKDESGHGRRGGWEDRDRADRDGGRWRDGRDGEERYTYDDGECRVEVRRERNGEVREERRCRGPARYGQGSPPPPYYGAYPPPQGYAPPPPPHGYAPPPYGYAPPQGYAPPPRPAPGGRGGWIEPGS